MQKENIEVNTKNSKELNFLEILFPIWESKKIIFIISISCSIVGAAIGFLTPETYTASSTFIPHTSEGANGTDLGGLAALAGVSFSENNSGTDISPKLYAKVIGSEPFRKQLLDAHILFNGDSITYGKFLTFQQKSLLETIRENTIGLPSKIISIISDHQTRIENIDSSNVNSNYRFISSISSKINISFDNKEGLVSITVLESNPIVAAQIAGITENLLKDWIKNYKVNKAKAHFDFIQKQFLIKEQEFYHIQEELASYMDRNKNVFSNSYLIKLNRIQAKFDLANSIYNELAKQKEQASIQLNKETPTFSIIEPVKIPSDKTSPNISIYLAAGFLIGFFGSLFFIMLMIFMKLQIVSEFLTDFKNKSSRLV